MKIKKNAAKQESRPVIVPRLIKAAEVVAREEAHAEAERVRIQALKEQAARPVVRAPRNAMEARQIFNSLFGEQAA